MVALRGIEGVEVSIIVDGEPLPEFTSEDLDTPDDNERTVKRYVECRSGAQFQIRTTFVGHVLKQKQRLSIKYVVDGTTTASRLYSTDSKGSRTVINQGPRISRSQIAPYEFSPLTEDTAGDQLSVHFAESLGCVAVRVQYVADKGYAAKISKKKYYEGKSIDKVQQKIITGRAISHSVGFGAPKTHEPEPRRRCTSPIGDAYCVKFFYRSRDDLKALRVIPRTPSPEPLHERDIDSLSREELLQLQQQVKQFCSSQQAVKREIKEEDDANRQNKRLKVADYVLVLDDETDDFRQEPRAQVVAPEDVHELE